jgi:porin
MTTDSSIRRTDQVSPALLADGFGTLLSGRNVMGVLSGGTRREHATGPDRVAVASAHTTVNDKLDARIDWVETGRVLQNAKAGGSGDLSLTPLRPILEQYCSVLEGLSRANTPKALTRGRVQPPSDEGFDIDTYLPGAPCLAGAQFGRARVRSFATAMLITVLTPLAASAECVFTEPVIAHGVRDGVPEDSALSNLWPKMATLGGVRPLLARGSIMVSGTYIGEVLGNPSGGVKQSTLYDGLLDVHLDANMETMIGWKGLCFHANMFQIHGTSITGENLLSIVSASNIEAFPSTRLDEMWLEQSMFSDKLSVRFGLLAADTEFMFADSAGAFIASTFGWTTLSSDNLPFGGPIYPFASPGVLVSVLPNDRLKLMMAIYDDNPIGACTEDLDPGQCNRSGLEFRLDDPPLLLAEADYSYNQGGVRPGTIKFGGWYDFGKFDDQRFDVNGGLQGITGLDPREHNGTYGIYGIIDQMVYRRPGEGKTGGISVFARVVGSPSDRNQVDAYFDAGVVFTGMIPRRPNDVFGVGLAYTGISDEASAFDRDSGLSIIRDHESLLEISYTAEIVPGWLLQPDLQYIWNPGGNVPDNSGSRAAEKAMVVGVRTTINF